MNILYWFLAKVFLKVSSRTFVVGTENGDEKREHFIFPFSTRSKVNQFIIESCSYSFWTARNRNELTFSLEENIKQSRLFQLFHARIVTFCCSLKTRLFS